MTSKEFAKLIGYSQPTVSRALSDSMSVTPETKAYIRAKAVEYGFMLNSQARSLKTKKTNSIGILFPSYFNDMSHNLMFTYIYDKLQREMIRRDYDVIAIAGNAADKIGAHALDRIIRSGKIDGVINFQPQLSAETIALIENFRMPCVSLHSGKQDSDRMYQLILDERNAGWQVGERFALNDRVNMYLGKDTIQPDDEPRYCGFRKALLGRKKQVDHTLCCQGSAEAVRDLITDQIVLFRSGKVNLFVYNDLMAVSAVQTLQSMGIAIPGDTQVISMDNIPMATWFAPALSTMATPVDDMVQACCDLLIRLVRGEKRPPFSQYFNSAFMERDTTEQ